MIVLAGNWWALALRGLFAVLFGITAFIMPGLTLAVLVLLYGAYVLVDGVFAVVASLAGRTFGTPWWAMLIRGLFGYCRRDHDVRVAGDHKSSPCFTSSRRGPS